MAQMTRRFSRISEINEKYLRSSACYLRNNLRLVGGLVHLSLAFALGAHLFRGAAVDVLHGPAL